MNIIKLNHRYDFGHDWYVQVLFTKRWALFQGCVSWNVYPSHPYLQVCMGMGKLISVLLSVYRLGIDFGICERTWNWGERDVQ